MDLERIYLDYNATSPLSQTVLNWLKSGDLHFANPSSQHSSGKSSRKVINEARAEIFSTFGKSEKETKLFFHSGASEAFSSFAHSFTEMARLKGVDLLICTSKTDHPCVHELSQRYLGPHVKFLELKKNKDLQYLHDENFELIKDKKENNPGLIILYHHLWVHNETGLVCPLNELKRLKEISDLFIHVDAVQSVGKIPEWRELTGGDIWTYSAHKFGALKGVGFSLMDKALPFYSLISGGGQQQGMRSGTENPMGTKSVSLALQDMKKINVADNFKLKEELLSFLATELQGLGKVLENPKGFANSNTIYFYLDNLSSDIALALFDLHGLEISAGSACSSGAARASDVLNHMGLFNVAKNGLRLSHSFHLNISDSEKIKGQLKKIFAKLKSSSL